MKLKENLAEDLRKALPAVLFRRMKTVAETCAAQEGLKPYLVGGMVRDLILKSPLRMDLDVTVTGGDLQALAGELQVKFSVKPSVSEFMTYTFVFDDGAHLDLITAREETYPKPAALPVVKPGTLQTDIARRDFSVNTIALSLHPDDWGEVTDLKNGREDLAKKTIRILHPQSFSDDPTRIFRAARFAARLVFHLSPDTGACLRQSLEKDQIRLLSRDRIRIELEKIMREDRPAPALGLLEDWGVLREVHPALVFDERNAALFRSFKTPASCGEDERIIFGMALWLAWQVPEESRDFLQKLHFPSHVSDRVLQILSLWNSFLEGEPAPSLPRTGIFPETHAFFKILAARTKMAGLKKGWEDWQKWLRSTPLLDGEALKDLGFVPGPVFKKILDALAGARYDGAVKTRAQEIRFVIDNFRRD